MGHDDVRVAMVAQKSSKPIFDEVVVKNQLFQIRHLPLRQVEGPIVPACLTDGAVVAACDGPPGDRVEVVEEVVVKFREVSSKGTKHLTLPIATVICQF